jgi:hypothetical protein
MKSLDFSIKPIFPAALTKRHPLSSKVDTNFVEKRLSLGIVRSHTKAMKFFSLLTAKQCMKLYLASLGTWNLTMFEESVERTY